MRRNKSLTELSECTENRIRPPANAPEGKRRSGTENRVANIVFCYYKNGIYAALHPRERDLRCAATG